MPSSTDIYIAQFDSIEVPVVAAINHHTKENS
jgi:hypothetical protein